MKNEIPASRTSAPIAIAATPPPLRLPGPAVVVGLMIVGVVTVGVGTDGVGSPGLNGLVAPFGAATATEAKLSKAITVAATRTLRRTTGTPAALGERLLHRGRLGGIDVGMLLGDVLLVVDALGVHRPDVVLRALEDVLDRSHRREHRVV
jgi:hypothetical protein